MMLLENSFYSINSERRAEDALEATFAVALLADCPVYQGHFPGRPVSPGVCNIGMIQECARRVAGNENLHLTKIKQCRLTAVAAPHICPSLEVKVTLTPADTQYGVQAQIAAPDGTLYMTLKGTLA